MPLPLCTAVTTIISAAIFSLWESQPTNQPTAALVPHPLYERRQLPQQQTKQSYKFISCDIHENTCILRIHVWNILYDAYHLILDVHTQDYRSSWTAVYHLLLLYRQQYLIHCCSMTAVDALDSTWLSDDDDNVRPQAVHHIIWCGIYTAVILLAQQTIYIGVVV